MEFKRTKREKDATLVSSSKLVLPNSHRIVAVSRTVTLIANHLIVPQSPWASAGRMVAPVPKTEV